MSPDLHTLTGAYAADALDDEERDLFELHLAACGDCDQEVRELRATTARLAAATAAPTPTQLRQRVLAQAARTRQLPPESPRVAVRARLRVDRALAAAAAVLLVASAGLGGLAAQQARRAADARRLAAAVAVVATDPGGRSATSEVSGGGTASVVAARGDAVFRASGLAPLPAGRGYELWTLDAGGATPVGMLELEDGSVVRYLPGAGRAQRLAMTVEPATGSAAPTTDPIVVLPVGT